MATLSVSIPEDIKETMDKFRGIDWSRVARLAISNKAKQLAFLKYFASDSDLTEQDALKFGKSVSKAVAGKYKELM